MRLKAQKLLTVFGVAVTAAVLLLMIGVCINGYVVHRGGKRIYTIEQMAGNQADCILVLGAGLKPNGTPSDMLRDRLSYAYRLWKNGASEVLLISGDRSSASYDEVTAMKKTLLSQGVPESAIVEDPQGFSTFESLERAKNVFGYRKIVIVTQRYHLYRALFIAEKLELDASGVNSDPFTYRGQALRDIREFLARVKDFLLLLAA